MSVCCKTIIMIGGERLNGSWSTNLWTTLCVGGVIYLCFVDKDLLLLLLLLWWWWWWWCVCVCVWGGGGGGGVILVSLRPSVSPSVRPSRIPCPLCSVCSSGWIHFIVIHRIMQLKNVCCVWSVRQNQKSWNFRIFFKFVTLTLSSFHLGSDVNH